jgi:hypothetical protein
MHTSDADIVIRWRRFNAVVGVLLGFFPVVLGIIQLRNHTSNAFGAYFVITLGIIFSLSTFKLVIQPKLILRACKEGIIFLLSRKLFPAKFEELLVGWDNIYSIQCGFIEDYDSQTNRVKRQEALEIKFIPGFNLNNLGNTEAVLQVPEDGNVILIPTSIMDVSVEIAIKKLIIMHQRYR